jgi:hypothetical protein
MLGGEALKRPSFQFYPADWRNNAKLRRCSEAARGAWIDVLCLLHDLDEYGVCRWPLAELARAAGVQLKLIKELVAKDVLKGADKSAADYVYTPRHAGKLGAPVTLVVAGDGPCWYCSRFVRDEYVRQRRGQGSRYSSDNQPGSVDGSGSEYEAPKDEQNTAPKASPKPPIGERQGDGPTSTSTSSLTTTTPKPPDGGSPPARTKPGAIALQTFLEACSEKGERPLRDYAPLWRYAESAGLSEQHIALAWVEFRRRFLPGGTGESKRYKDWRAAFRKYVEGNYLKLWAIDGNGQYFLTTLGKQAQKIFESKEAA